MRTVDQAVKFVQQKIGQGETYFFVRVGRSIYEINMTNGQRNIVRLDSPGRWRRFTSGLSRLFTRRPTHSRQLNDALFGKQAFLDDKPLTKSCSRR